MTLPWFARSRRRPWLALGGAVVVAASLGTLVGLAGPKSQPCRPIAPFGSRPPYHCLTGTLPPGSPDNRGTPGHSSCLNSALPNHLIYPMIVLRWLEAASSS